MNLIEMNLPVDTDVLNDLRRKARAPLSDGCVLEHAKSLSSGTLIGVAKNLELIADIRKWRRFFAFSSFYGHRLGRSISVIGDLRTEGYDLYCTDSSGYIKNAPDAQCAIDRISDAKRNGIPVIAFFGGSTMMGQGARVPEFSIPALVEQVLRTEHDCAAVCVNFGVGAWMCSDALHLLIHEVLPLEPDLVLFYDGWNCCSYLTANEFLRESGIPGVPVSYRGTQPRHIENDMTLSYQFGWLKLLARSANLLVNEMLSFATGLFRTRFVERSANALLSSLFSIRSSTDIYDKLNSAMEDSELAAVACRRAVAEYLRIHRLANCLCSAQGTRFVTCLQPLVFCGEKKLSPQENEWRENGFSSGNPAVFKDFYDQVRSEVKGFDFFDITGVFDAVHDETYIDSGHLNRIGNLLVAEKLGKIVNESLTGRA